MSSPGKRPTMYQVQRFLAQPVIAECSGRCLYLNRVLVFVLQTPRKPDALFLSKTQTLTIVSLGSRYLFTEHSTSPFSGAREATSYLLALDGSRVAYAEWLPED